VIKNRAFFFLSWEERKDRSESAQSRTVPTDSFKQGFVFGAHNNGGIQTFSPSEITQIDPIAQAPIRTSSICFKPILRQ